MTERLYLQVPFAQKEEVKAVGGRWDSEKKLWFVDKSTDIKKVEKWLLVEKSQRRALPGRLLTVELVPKSCWFSNVRNHVSASEWEVVKAYTFKKAGYKCEVCGGVGEKHPVECHEIWNYDDTNHIQTLEGTVALCPSCHRVKHFGLAQVHGVGDVAALWLSQINGWNEIRTITYINEAFEVWEKRSDCSWKLNVDWLNETFGLKVVTER